MVEQKSSMRIERIEGRLLSLATLFLTLYSLALTLSPAVRARSWQVEYRWEHWLGVLAWALVFSLAHDRLSKWLPNRDPFLLPVAALLSGWGMLTVWRLLPPLGIRQGVWVFVSGLVLIVGARAPSDLGFLRRYKYLWLTGSLVLTTATLFFGTNPLGYGPRMWLGCCGLYMQPSEPLKLLFIAYLGAYLADQEPLLALSRLRRVKDKSHAGKITWGISSTTIMPVLAPTIIVIGLALALLMIQRDMGTASIFLILYAVLVYFASGRKPLLFSTVLALVLAGIVGYFSFAVVRVRVDAWINPWLDPSGGSYQIIQSLIAIANGGLSGRGPGVGNPGLVPVAHSDLIYAAIAEESGLIGAVGLLVLFALVAARGMLIALRAANTYHRYLAAGLTVYLVGQGLLIIGGSIRLLPLTGVTLPFVSYGGSSLVTSFLSLLILMHISHYSHQGISEPNQPAMAHTYQEIMGALFFGLAAVVLATGWWAVYRAPDLLARSDNPRRAIADRSVRRGFLLDRKDAPINITQGTSGEYSRQYLYPGLGNVAGYSSPLYGQSGLEASLDEILRGLEGNPAIQVWWHRLLYGQPPPGLDIRLTLDMELQNQAEQVLVEHNGALVLLDASDGQVLLMNSHPTFDPNDLESNWETLIEDPNSPLLNRAAQGQYSPGAILGPLLLAKAQDEGVLPELPGDLTYSSNGRQIECAVQPQYQEWARAVAGGCPGAVAALGEGLGSVVLGDFYQSLGLYDPPRLRLPVAETTPADEIADPAAAALGEDIPISPLQLALAAATISADGIRPAPVIAKEMKSPEKGWIPLAALDVPVSALTPESAHQSAEQLSFTNQVIWQAVAISPGAPESIYTWYMGGTIPSSGNDPFVLVLLLEEENPEIALQIGNTMLLQACFQE
jgi:cell division protein FtsW (lipid II flippase)